MTSDWRSFRVQTISGIVVVILTPVLLAVLGLLPDTWAFARGVSGALMRVLGQRQSIATWLLIIISLAALWGIALTLTLWVRARADEREHTELPPWWHDPSDSVGQLCDDLMRKLAAANGRTVLRQDFEKHYRDRRLEVEEAIARLHHAAVIVNQGGFGTPDEFALTPRGRAYVIHARLIRAVA